MKDREFIAKFHYCEDSHKCGQEPYAIGEEIVRCKKCKHRCTDDCPMCNECGRKAYPTSDDDFCSWGERKEGE